jgi:proline iminopeptidase
MKFEFAHIDLHLKCLLLISGLVFNLHALTAQTSKPFAGYIDINGTRLYTEIKGRGETIVVLHGGPGLNQSYLHPHFNELSKRFRLVFIDMRGHGKSDLPSSDSLRLQYFIDDIEALRVHLKQDKLNIIAHSWGSIVAIKYATLFPEHVHKLMLLHPAALSSEYQALASIKQRELFNKQDSTDRANILSSAEFKNNHYKAFQDLYMISFRHTFYNPEKISKLNLQLEENHAKSGRALGAALSKDLSDFDFYPALDRLTFPILIIHGMLDALPIQAVEELQLKLPEADLKTFKYCAHFLFIEQPRTFTELSSAFFRKK